MQKGKLFKLGNCFPIESLVVHRKLWISEARENIVFANKSEKFWEVDIHELTIENSQKTHVPKGVFEFAVKKKYN